jgi:gliding motility-associated-like protein
MKPFRQVILFVFLLGVQALCAQVSADCIDAIPICDNTPINGGTNGFGVDDFNGAKESGCLEETPTSEVIESNSAWYRFRTGASGQLGFNIGFHTNEDWDFALYRTDNCNDLGEPIRCNFFDNTDQNTFIGVGEDPTGLTDNIQYEEWLQVEPGEDYYLLINNFSNGNDGFSIQFTGNIFVTNPNDALDCSIVSDLLGAPISACEFDTVILDATTKDALDYTWYRNDGAGFEEIIGEKNPTLNTTTSAIYRVVVEMPMENIIAQVQVAFSTIPTAHPVNDEAACSGMDTFDLSLKDAEVLGGQDPNDAVVSYHATLADAIARTDFLPRQLPTPNGSQTIYIRVTSAENPDCFDAPQQFQLQNVDSPKMDFPAEAFLCNEDGSTSIGPASSTPGYSYSWDSGETTPAITVTQKGSYTLTITNSEGGLYCSDMKTIVVSDARLPQILDVEINDLQNNNTVTVIPDIEGEWQYQLDDGLPQTSNVFTEVQPGSHEVQVIDPRGCGAVSEPIVVVGFLKFFTPNGDGRNDNWNITGLSELENPVITIYDRYGKLLKQLSSQSPSWDGTFNGSFMPSADYWFKLSYTDANGQTTTAKYVNNHFSLRR